MTPFMKFWLPLLFLIFVMSVCSVAACASVIIMFIERFYYKVTLPLSLPIIVIVAAALISMTTIFSYFVTQWIATSHAREFAIVGGEEDDAITQTRIERLRQTKLFFRGLWFILSLLYAIIYVIYLSDDPHELVVLAITCSAAILFVTDVILARIPFVQSRSVRILTRYTIRRNNAGARAAPIPMQILNPAPPPNLNE